MSRLPRVQATSDAGSGRSKAASVHRTAVRSVSEGGGPLGIGGRLCQVGFILEGVDLEVRIGSLARQANKNRIHRKQFAREFFVCRPMLTVTRGEGNPVGAIATGIQMQRPRVVVIEHRLN